MIHLKDKPIGIDLTIQNAQKRLYNGLMSKWSDDLDAYGRCYVNKSKLDGENESYVPEYYDKNGETPNLLYTEGNKFFFTVSNTIPSDSSYNYKADISIYFIVNLEKVRPDIKHRADSEVYADVYEILAQCGLGNKIDLVHTVKKVYEDFKVKSGDFDDIHPYHVFKFKARDVIFNILKQC